MITPAIEIARPLSVVIVPVPVSVTPLAAGEVTSAVLICKLAPPAPKIKVFVALPSPKAVAFCDTVVPPFKVVAPL